jgi:hypothetical protein
MATFDTLTAARRLKEAGATDAVAEAIAETMRDARDFDLSQLATKSYLSQLATKADLHESEARLRADGAALDAKIAATELRLLKWLIGTGIAAVIAIVGALSGVIWTAMQLLLHAHS